MGPFTLITLDGLYDGEQGLTQRIWAGVGIS